MNTSVAENLRPLIEMASISLAATGELHNSSPAAAAVFKAAAIHLGVENILIFKRHAKARKQILVTDDMERVALYDIINREGELRDTTASAAA